MKSENRHLVVRRVQRQRKIEFDDVLHFQCTKAYQAFYEPYYDTFNFCEGRKEWLRSISTPPLKAVHLFSLHWLHLVVYNGGFWQYFYNSTGTSAPEVVEGFATIGMPEVCSIVQDAMSKLGTPYPGDKATREVIVGPWDDGMDIGELNDAFYELADTETFFRKLPDCVPFADAYAAVPG
ncbi:DUF4375 domain-containing protein [Tropicibacter sp. Alg240-R139]|uniref:DMP19 family protein n=1 Tax=Tropicibacter sp. Alg240-R139 TaxID=2305991 RepID=UPI0013DEB40F|nr:DUF4375 domain-containing protein [Tropicibacter sp. Alg240-R139]